MQVALEQESPRDKRFDPEPVLRIENLQYRIGLTSILKGIRMELGRGEVLTILGPNGAGKSTLLKCVAGILPHSGSQELFGCNPRRNYGLRKRVGYLGHESLLYSKLSARENLLFYAGLYGIQVDPDTTLREYFLADSAEQLVETFSRGMKQRLALARSLLSNPELVLMDEPFTGLDQQSSELLETKIKEMRGTVSFVIATHELERAFQLSDRLLILKNGRMVFSGLKQEIDAEIHDFYRLKTS